MGKKPTTNSPKPVAMEEFFLGHIESADRANLYSNNICTFVGVLVRVEEAPAITKLTGSAERCCKSDERVCSEDRPIHM